MNGDVATDHRDDQSAQPPSLHTQAALICHTQGLGKSQIASVVVVGLSRTALYDCLTGRDLRHESCRLTTERDRRVSASPQSGISEKSRRAIYLDNLIALGQG